MARLRACDGCSRHVRIEESTCPFCGCELTAVAELPRSASAPWSGFSRSQRLMLAAAIAGQSLGACAKTTEDPDMHPVGGEAVAGAAAGPGSGSAGFAGATLAGRGGAGTAGDPWPFGMTVPPYGISPLPPDAGKPDPSDAGKPKPSEEDAGDEDAGTE